MMTTYMVVKCADGCRYWLRGERVTMRIVATAGAADMVVYRGSYADCRRWLMSKLNAAEDCADKYARVAKDFAQSWKPS